MYGIYLPPFSLKKRKGLIWLKKEGEIWSYYRKVKNEEKEKQVVFSKGEVLINPVEPVNLPKEISSHLLIKLKNEVIVAPKEKLKFYLTFPIEIAVILSAEGKFRLLDIFSFVQPKYTLYGDVRKGIICKYWESKVYPKIPKADLLEEGIMEVIASNASSEWVDVKQLVFSAYTMKIYYDESIVAMRARVKILSEEIAETSFVDSALKKGMKKSIEIFKTKKIVIPIQEKFVMEEGV